MCSAAGFALAAVWLRAVAGAGVASAQARPFLFVAPSPPPSARPASSAARRWVPGSVSNAPATRRVTRSTS